MTSSFGRKRDRQRLLGVLKTLRYEKRMLVWCIGEIQQIPPMKPGEPSSIRFRRNAVEESFLLHARNVRYFLFDKATDDDTAAAGHFFPTQTHWENVLPLQGKYLVESGPSSVKLAANKRLAHITDIRESAQTIDVSSEGNAILKELLSALDHFERHASEPPGILVDPKDWEHYREPLRS